VNRKIPLRIPCRRKDKIYFWKAGVQPSAIEKKRPQSERILSLSGTSFFQLQNWKKKVLPLELGQDQQQDLVHIHFAIENPLSTLSIVN
jgi:hypothetical protein